MSVDTTELRKLAEAATPGPWKALGTGVSGGDHWYVCDAGEAIAYIAANDGTDEEMRQPLAEFMAAASPSTVIALLDRLAVAEDALARHEDRCVEEDSEFVYRIQQRAVVAEGKITRALAVTNKTHTMSWIEDLIEIRRILTEGAPE